MNDDDDRISQPHAIGYSIDPESLSFQTAFYCRIARSETFAFLLRIHERYINMGLTQK